MSQQNPASTDRDSSPFSSAHPHTLSGCYTSQHAGKITGQKWRRGDKFSSEGAHPHLPCSATAFPPPAAQPPATTAFRNGRRHRLGNCHGGPPLRGTRNFRLGTCHGGKAPASRVGVTAAPQPGEGDRGRKEWCHVGASRGAAGAGVGCHGALRAPAAMALSAPPPARVFAELTPARAPTPAPVPAGRGGPPGREVHVSGSAELSASPDRARVSLRLSSRKDAAGAARSSVARRLEYIAQSARQRGVPVRASPGLRLPQRRGGTRVPRRRWAPKGRSAAGSSRHLPGPPRPRSAAGAVKRLPAGGKSSGGRTGTAPKGKAPAGGPGPAGWQRSGSGVCGSREGTGRRGAAMKACVPLGGAALPATAEKV